jgi:hypothetical protein
MGTFVNVMGAVALELVIPIEEGHCAADGGILTGRGDQPPYACHRYI